MGVFCSEGVVESRTVLVCRTKNGHAEARFCMLMYAVARVQIGKPPHRTAMVEWSNGRELGRQVLYWC